MSTFDDFTHTSFSSYLNTIHARDDLLNIYTNAIERCMERWKGRYNRQQSLFMARTTAYVSVLRELLMRNGDIKWDRLPEGFPVLGPRFIPPATTTLALQKKSISFYYLKPFTLVDPQVYEPDTYTRQAMCGHYTHNTGEGISKKDFTLPRTCYGLLEMEYVGGVTYYCAYCKKTSSTTSVEYWQKLDYARMPVWVPLFRKKSCFSPTVMSYVRNHRVATTSRDLGNSWHMLHVKTYLDRKRTYLESLVGHTDYLDSAFEFSPLEKVNEYDGVKEINAKLINIIWAYQMNNGGLAGFASYMKSLVSEKTTNISWDATHSFAEKGKTIINNERVSAMKSLSVIVCNQNYIQSAIFTYSHRNIELGAQFEAFAKRLDSMQIKRKDGYGRMLYGRDIIDKVGTDYTEKYGAMIKKVFPKSAHSQDVFHWLCRFHLGIKDGVRNQYHHEIVVAISIAWREAKTREDMISNFNNVYHKYQLKGGIWNVLAKDIFDRQLERVRNGWMDKTGDSANTSRVENKFRHIERVQATFTCSLQLFESLGLAKIDHMNRNNGKKLGDHFILQTNGYSDTVYSNMIQTLEAELFQLKRKDIAILTQPTNNIEQFGVVKPPEQRSCVSREDPEEDALIDEYDDEGTDYLPLAIANDYLDQCELESLGLDASKRNEAESPTDDRYTPIAQLIERQLPAADLVPREAYVPPHPTTTMSWLQRRADIPPEYFSVGQGYVYHMFMKLRREHKWRSAPGDTNFRAAQIAWKRELDAYHARYPDEERLPEYDYNVLRKKCIEVEKNLPIYLQHWQSLSDEGVEIWINKEQEECDVAKKLQYWKMQDLRDEITATPATQRGKVDICKRCNMRKSHGSGHSVRTCTDGVLISADKEAVRFPQPSGLFVGKDGRLDQTRFYWLLEHARNNPLNDSETEHFFILARQILMPDRTLNQVRLASLNIELANAATFEEHKVWQSRRETRHERDSKRSRLIE